MAILRAALEDVLAGDTVVALGPRVRVGAPSDVPLATVEAIALDEQQFTALKAALMAVEIERYSKRPLLQYPVEAFETTMHDPRATGVALRDSVSGKVIAYALGGPPRTMTRRVSPSTRTTARAPPFTCRRWRRCRRCATCTRWSDASSSWCARGPWPRATSTCRR